MSDAAVAVDPRFPGLRPEVVEGYLRAPAHMVAEVLDGELFVMSRPRRQHSRASSRLGGELYAPFDRGGGPGGWVILDEPELHLGSKPDIVVPDLAGWRRERVSEDFFDDEAPAHIELVPDWVCEVISPSTEREDRGVKMRIYRREKVGHVWLLDPAIRTLEVYRLENGRYSLLDTFDGDDAVRAEPFDAIALELRVLWAR
jgi:Uma2 family endonuclease